jgi:NADPH-dependent curcumin reductase CurA
LLRNDAEIAEAGYRLATTPSRSAHTERNRRLEPVPEAFIGLLHSKNFGKLVIQLIGE